MSYPVMKFFQHNISLTDKFIAATGISDNTIINALRTMEASLNNYRLTSKIKALYPFVGGTASTHKFNFMDARDLDAAFRLSFNGTWTHNSNGAKGNNAYANTFLNPHSQFSTCHISKYTTDNLNANTDEVDLGARSEPSNNLYMGLWYKAGSYSNFLAKNSSESTMLNGGTTTDSRGFGCVSKVNTTAKLYKNSLEVASANDTGVLPNINIYIGCQNLYGVATYYTSRTNTFISIGDGLTSQEVSNLYAIVRQLQADLGRQV